MTWATIEEAWGNYDEMKNNFQENFQNFNSSEILEEETAKKPVKKRVNKIVKEPKNDIIDINDKSVYEIGNEDELDKPVAKKIYKDYVDNDQINEIVNKKIARMTQKTEEQIYKLTLEMNKIVKIVNSLKNNNGNDNSINAIFNKNIHDILLL